MFISKNNVYYDDYEELLDKMYKLSNAILFKVTNLEINLKMKFLIFNASYTYKMNINKFREKNDKKSK